MGADLRRARRDTPRTCGAASPDTLAQYQKPRSARLDTPCQYWQSRSRCTAQYAVSVPDVA
eukprot:3937208-Rhodomonas_salina.6